MLTVPNPVIGLYTGHRADRLTRAVTRVLGSRHLIQAILTAGTPSAPTLPRGVQVDLAHVASMLGLAVLDQRRRRAGLVDAFAVAGVVLARRASALPDTSRLPG
ncbi:MAG: hypothetical protein H0V41_18785 [Pseudonocardiales bacterium]|nr:hypothetical protein [Pseudonocardiales bacterium]